MTALQTRPSRCAQPPPAFEKLLDRTVLCDVIERHAVRQPLALQRLVRQLQRHGAGSFNGLHSALKSQCLAISREHLAELVDYLESVFLISSLSVVGGSLRGRVIRRRKVYPIDLGQQPL